MHAGVAELAVLCISAEDVAAHEKKQQALHDLIVSLFRLRRRLSYFQVCQSARSVGLACRG